MDEEQRERVALFRYGVIGELVNGPLAPGEKEKLLTRLSQKEWQIPGTHRTQIGRATLRDWVSAYRAMGLDGLKPQPRSDAGQSRALPETVQALLLAMRKERPKASLESLIRAVRLSGRIPADVRMAPSTVHRMLAAHGMPTVEPAGAEPDARAFTYPHANDLWTSDVMHGPRLLVPGRRDGGKTYLIAFLDDATRMVPFAAFYASENAACFTDAFKQAMLRRGVPRKLYTDNGATFRTHHLQVVCAVLSIVLMHSRPYKPRGRGKVERFFRTVRSAFLPHVTPEMLRDLASLNRVFWAWLEAEYHQTPHGGLDGKTPLDRFLDDGALLRPAPDDLDAVLRMRVVRKVGRDRTVQLFGRVYEAPDGFAGETVEVRFDPYDPARPVHMVRKGEAVEIRLHRLDLHVNAKTPRAKAAERVEDAPPPTGISYLDLVAKKYFGDDDGEALMYRPFFGLSRPPFERDLPPDQLFRAPALDELHARLCYLAEARSIGLLVGEPGSGKSTALRRLKESLHPDQVRPIYLHDTSVNAADFYRQLALELGIEPHWSRAMTFRAVQQEIVRLARERRLTVMLVVDEAHRLRPDVLAEFPLLTNFEWDSAGNLALLLCGTPGLRQRLRMADLESLTQRITVRYALRGVDRDATRLYLEHRLRIAGVDRPLFSEPAIEALFNASQGVFRRIDNVAHHALAAAAAARARIVDADHVVQAAEELRA